jgi:hypothetical protein
MEADQFLLCQICLGMSEESMIDLPPQSQDNIGAVRQVYYHQPASSLSKDPRLIAVWFANGYLKVSAKVTKSCMLISASIWFLPLVLVAR